MPWLTQLLSLASWVTSHRLTLWSERTEESLWLQNFSGHIWLVELTAFAQHSCLDSTDLADFLGTFGSVVLNLFGGPWTFVGIWWKLCTSLPEICHPHLCTLKPQFFFHLYGLQASRSLSVNHRTSYLNGAAKGKNPKMRNTIHSSRAPCGGGGLLGWMLVPLVVACWAERGQTHPDSACIALWEGSPHVTSCSSTLPSARRVTSGLRKRRLRSLPARILGLDAVLALTWQGLLPCSCVLFPSLSLSSSERLLCWFLFCWHAWYPGPVLGPRPCRGLC